MITFKKFENMLNGPVDFNGIVLSVGDRVVFYKKNSPNFLKTGILDNVYSNEICLIKSDFHKNDYFNSYPEYLIKIDCVTDIDTGEILMIPYENMKDLAEMSLIQYDKKRNAYFFDNDVKWQVERYSL